MLASQAELERALRAYDAGLYGGQFASDQIKITVGKNRKAEKLGHVVVRRTITIDGFDPFATRKPLTTHLDTFRWFCPATGRTTILILRSPREDAEADRVWATLRPFWENYACHQGSR